MQIELIPRGLLRRKVDVLVDGASRGSLERSAWGGENRLTLDGAMYRIAGEGWLRRKWTLSERGRTRATAEPEGFFGGHHVIELRGAGGRRPMVLGNDGLFARGRALKRGTRTLARCRPRGFFAAGVRIEARSDLALEVLVFVAAVMMTLDERRRRGAGAMPSG